MAYLEGTCTTGGEVTANVKVYAFRSGQWGAPATGTSDFAGKWRVDGLIDNVLYDVAFVHPEGEWEGKMSSRRMPIFDPFADPYWEDTTLLVHFDDINGQVATNERGIDTYKIWGNGALISDVAPPPKFGTGCLNINNNASGTAGFWYGTQGGIGAAGSPPFINTTDNFTVEGWFYCRGNVSTNTYRDICILANADKGVVINGSSQLVYYDSGIKINGPGMGPYYDRWVWLVIQRENGTTAVWLDGAKIGSFIDLSEKNCFRLGSNTSNSEQFFGGFDEWRHTRAARYVGSPTTIDIPTSPYNTGNPIRSDSFNVPRLWNYLKEDSGSAVWGIMNGKLETTNSSTGASVFARADFKAINAYCEAEVYTAQTCGFVLRYVDVNNFYMVSLSDNQAHANAEPNNAKFYKRVAGNYTQIGSTMPIVLPRGSANKVRVEIQGNTMKLFVNGVTVGSVNDNSITISGKIGLRSASGSGYDGLYSVDNFKWDTIL